MPPKKQHKLDVQKLIQEELFGDDGAPTKFFSSNTDEQMAQQVKHVLDSSQTIDSVCKQNAYKILAHWGYQVNGMCQTIIKETELNADMCKLFFQQENFANYFALLLRTHQGSKGNCQVIFAAWNLAQVENCGNDEQVCNDIVNAIVEMVQHCAQRLHILANVNNFGNIKAGLCKGLLNILDGFASDKACVLSLGIIIREMMEDDIKFTAFFAPPMSTPLLRCLFLSNATELIDLGINLLQSRILNRLISEEEICMLFNCYDAKQQWRTNSFARVEEFCDDQNADTDPERDSRLWLLNPNVNPTIVNNLWISAISQQSDINLFARGLMFVYRAKSDSISQAIELFSNVQNRSIYFVFVIYTKLFELAELAPRSLYTQALVYIRDLSTCETTMNAIL